MNITPPQFSEVQKIFYRNSHIRLFKTSNISIGIICHRLVSQPDFKAEITEYISGLNIEPNQWNFTVSFQCLTHNVI